MLPAIANTTRILLLFFIIITTTATGLLSKDCPSGCDCKKGSDNETLQVACENISEFPRGLANTTLSLSVIGSQTLKRLTQVHLAPNLLGTSSLRRLVLSDNAIERIDPNALALQSALFFLYLNNNSLTGFEPGTFKRNTRLEVLNISHNRLNAIKVMNGLSVPELRLLDMSHCDLDSIDSQMFVQVPTLRELRLAYNNLQMIEAELFSPLDILEYLYLSHNRINFIVDKAFTRLRHLKVLDLSYNKLTELDPRLFFYLNNLDDLYLNNNLFKTFESDWIKTLSLKRLSLNSNYILNFNYMRGLENITDLNLADNQISNLDVNVVCRFKSLKYLNVTLNPLRCGCGLRATWEALRDRVLFLAQCQPNASIAILRVDHALPPLDCGAFFQCPRFSPKSEDPKGTGHFNYWPTVLYYLYIVVIPVIACLVVIGVIISTIVYLRRRKRQRPPFERTNVIVYTPNSYQEAFDPIQKVYAEISEMQPFRDPPHSLYTFNPGGVYAGNRLSNPYEMQQHAEIAQHHSYQSLGPGTSGSLYRRSGLEPGAMAAPDPSTRKPSPKTHRIYQPPPGHGPSSSSGRDIESDDSWVEHL